MRKVRMIFPQRVREGVVARLHEAGVVHLKEISELEVTRRAVGEEVYELSSLIAKFREMQEFLGPPGRAVGIRELTYTQTLKKAKKLLGEVEPKLSTLKARSEELGQRKQEVFAQMEILENFKEIEIPLSYLRPTDEIQVAVGRIAEERVPEFSGAVREALEQRVFVWVLGKGKQRISIIACRARDQQKLSPVFYRYEVELLEVPPIEKSPAMALKELEKRLAGLDKERANIEGRKKKLARARSGEVSALLELLEIQMERLRSAGLFGFTDATAVIEGWAPEKKADLEPLISAVTNGRHIIRIYEPQKAEIGVVPIQLENPRVMGDFELITETYGLPRYDEVDPTPFVAFTFPLFFAMCLSDAGYGVVLGLFMASGIWIAKAFPRRLRMVMVVGAAFTVVIGALVGGWFGGVIPPLWFDSMKTPITYLKLAVIVGILQLLLAFGGVAALKDVFRRDWKSLILDHLPRFLIVMGFFGLTFFALGVSFRDFGIDFTFSKMSLFDAFNPITPAPTLAVAFRILLYSGLGIGMIGAALKGEGLRGKLSGPINVVYGIAGFVADAASYGRLMALGIATGIVAFAINYIVGWLWGSSSPPLLGISVLLAVPLVIMFGFVLFAAHSFNVFIQSLGAVIHTMRLHYVEFFGKFYEGGGEKFTPFKVKRVFTKIERR